MTEPIKPWHWLLERNSRELCKEVQGGSENYKKSFPRYFLIKSGSLKESRV